MNVFALESERDKPGVNGTGLSTNAVEGETVNPVAYPEPAGGRASNNTRGNNYTIQVTKDGVTYIIGYVVRSVTILPEEISGMDSDQALEYITNKSMTFYTDPNTTVIPDIVFGRDYFVRINGSNHVIPEALLGSYRLEIANNSDFNNAATTTVTIGSGSNGGNGNNGGNGENSNIIAPDKPNANVSKPIVNYVRGMAKRLSANVRTKGRGRAALTARAHQANANDTANSSALKSADNAGNSENSSSSSESAARAGSGNGGNGAVSNRVVETAANAATAGAGVGSFWFIILIISDIKLLLWYKKFKEAKRKSTV